MKRRFKKGDRVRLKVRTIFGWKGTGTVTEDSDGHTVAIRRDGYASDDCCLAGPHELTRVRPSKDPFRLPPE